MQKITKEITIGELIRQYPGTAELLLAEGIHCIGCGAANFETLEQGLAGHGRSADEIEKIVNALNEQIPDKPSSSEELIITQSAAKKLKEFVDKQEKPSDGMRIKVEVSGCEGLSYHFDIEEKSKSDDELIEVSGLKFFIDPSSFDLLKGATIDYIETPEASGFKITNPSA